MECSLENMIVSLIIRDTMGGGRGGAIKLGRLTTLTNDAAIRFTRPLS